MAGTHEQRLVVAGDEPAVVAVAGRDAVRRKIRLEESADGRSVRFVDRVRRGARRAPLTSRARSRDERLATDAECGPGCLHAVLVPAGQFAVRRGREHRARGHRGGRRGRDLASGENGQRRNGKRSDQRSDAVRHEIVRESHRGLVAVRIVARVGDSRCDRRMDDGAASQAAPAAGGCRRTARRSATGAVTRVSAVAGACRKRESRRQCSVRGIDSVKGGIGTSNARPSSATI